MTGQDLSLAMVLAAFATFTLTLAGVRLWSRARRAAREKKGLACPVFPQGPADQLEDVL